MASSDEENEHQETTRMNPPPWLTKYTRRQGQYEQPPPARPPMRLLRAPLHAPSASEPSVWPPPPRQPWWLEKRDREARELEQLLSNPRYYHRHRHDDEVEDFEYEHGDGRIPPNIGLSSSPTSLSPSSSRSSSPPPQEQEREPTLIYPTRRTHGNARDEDAKAAAAKASYTSTIGLVRSWSNGRAFRIDSSDEDEDKEEDGDESDDDGVFTAQRVRVPRSLRRAKGAEGGDGGGGGDAEANGNEAKGDGKFARKPRLLVLQRDRNGGGLGMDPSSFWRSRSSRQPATAASATSASATFERPLPAAMTAPARARRWGCRGPDGSFILVAARLHYGRTGITADEAAAEAEEKKRRGAEGSEDGGGGDGAEEDIMASGASAEEGGGGGSSFGGFDVACEVKVEVLRVGAGDGSSEENCREDDDNDGGCPSDENWIQCETHVPAGTDLATAVNVLVSDRAVRSFRRRARRAKAAEAEDGEEESGHVYLADNDVANNDDDDGPSSSDALAELYDRCLKNGPRTTPVDRGGGGGRFLPQWGAFIRQWGPGVRGGVFTAVPWLFKCVAPFLSLREAVFLTARRRPPAALDVSGTRYYDGTFLLQPFLRRGGPVYRHRTATGFYLYREHEAAAAEGSAEGSAKGSRRRRRESSAGGRWRFAVLQSGGTDGTGTDSGDGGGDGGLVEYLRGQGGGGGGGGGGGALRSRERSFLYQQNRGCDLPPLCEQLVDFGGRGILRSKRAAPLPHVARGWEITGQLDSSHFEGGEGAVWFSFPGVTIREASGLFPAEQGLEAARRLRRRLPPPPPSS